jgi:hypothetical protein
MAKGKDEGKDEDEDEGEGEGESEGEGEGEDKDKEQEASMELDGDFDEPPALGGSRGKEEKDSERPHRSAPGKAKGYYAEMVKHGLFVD